MSSVSRHLWVGGLPEDMSEQEIKDYFSKLASAVLTVMVLPLSLSIYIKIRTSVMILCL